MDLRGTFGPKYWWYMARCMKRRVNKFIENRTIVGGEIPAGVFSESKSFFTHAKGGYEKLVRTNAGAYAITNSILRHWKDCDSLEKRISTLKELSDFNESLDKPRRLTEAEIITASKLAEFFEDLSQLHVRTRMSRNVWKALDWFMGR